MGPYPPIQERQRKRWWVVDWPRILVSGHLPYLFSLADACRQRSSTLHARLLFQVDFLEELPTMNTAEMEDLYRHFLLDDMPEVNKLLACPHV